MSGDKEQDKQYCEGCKHRGLYENEIEYGYPSPCTKCRRRCLDYFTEQAIAELDGKDINVPSKEGER